MNADGSGRQLLAADTLTPAWSADWRRIVFVKGSDHSFDIYVMNADGSGQRRLTRTAGRDWDPVWSPDGRQIAFLRERDADNWPPNFDNFEVYVMNADGSGQRRLTGKTAHVPCLVARRAEDRLRQRPRPLRHERRRKRAAEPDGHDDGRRSISCLVTRRADDRLRERPLFARSTAAGALLRPLRRERRWERTAAAVAQHATHGAPAWSPDGQKIAFASVRDGNQEIYVMNADGSGQQRLTRNTAGDYAPAWSPDGRKIAFVSQRDGHVNHEIYLMNTLTEAASGT